MQKKNDVNEHQIIDSEDTDSQSFYIRFSNPGSLVPRSAPPEIQKLPKHCFPTYSTYSKVEFEIGRCLLASRLSGPSIANPKPSRERFTHLRLFFFLFTFQYG